MLDDGVIDAEIEALAQQGLGQLDAGALAQIVSESLKAQAEQGNTAPAVQVGRGTHLTPLVETPETLAFICGPPAMLSGVTAALTALGIPEEQIRTESW